MAREDFLGCPVDLVDREGLRRQYAMALAGGARLRIEGLNVAKVVQARRDPELLAALREAEAIHVDGMGVRWGMAIAGMHSGERVAGVDLLMDICAHCAAQRRSVYLLGARQEVAERTAAALVAAYPALRIAGVRNGYFSEDEWDEVAEAVRASGADALFVGISSPMKERFLARLWDRLGVQVAMGVGGAFDVIAGDLRRAPVLVQRAGCEWVWRMAQEPRRLFGRYMRTNAIFAGLLLRRLLSRALRKSTGAR